uniref:Uncharacterized protein n=1 Tax=Aegilops tauschii subsp. strangulata TaxID=200361 RepID=A0A453R0E3_AEGTS
MWLPWLRVFPGFACFHSPDTLVLDQSALSLRVFFGVARFHFPSHAGPRSFVVHKYCHRMLIARAPAFCGRKNIEVLKTN